MPGRVIRAVIRGDTEFATEIGARVYPADATPANAALPLIAYSIQSNAPTSYMSGGPVGYLVTVDLTVIGRNYGEVTQILLRLPSLFAAVEGDIESLTVDGAEVTDLGDEPNGPIDLDGRTGYLGTATVQFFYRG